MISFESELERLRPILGNAATDALVARERRDLFSIYPELRLMAWGGATLLAAAAGVLLKNNLERLGPVVLTILLTLAALGCYTFVRLRRARATIADDYILLLGALLASADVAFIETQFDVLGDLWTHHFLILALLHGVTAYLFDSRIVLTLAIASLGAWLGARTDGTATAFRLFAASIATLLWREADARLRPSRSFARTFEHFAAHYALLGALVLTGHRPFTGWIVTLAFAAVVIAWGFRNRSEPFVLFAFVYAVIATNLRLVPLVRDEALGFLVILLSMIAAIAGLFVLHARFRE